jgi:arylsulfatase A-like enzyme
VQRRRRFGSVVLALLAMGFPLGCERSHGVGDPNILLVTLDTVRADHCSSYGYSRSTTPHLSALARDGVQFDSAYSPMPTSAPAHASIFTGLHPRSHGLIRNGTPIPDDHVTLPQLLAANGYDTGAVVSSFVLASRFGFQRGFAFYDDAFGDRDKAAHETVWEGIEINGRFERRASETTARALRWLAGHAARALPVAGEHRAGTGGDARAPFFLWVHYFDPHSPYDPPEPYRSAFESRAPGAGTGDLLRAAYDGELAYADSELGRLIEAVRAQEAPERTLVIVVGDHGEGLGDHGHLEHGLMLYDEALLVPFVVSWPGVVSGNRRSAEPVSLVDLTPTIIDLLGMARPAVLQGRSLAPALLGSISTLAQRPVFLQRRFYGASSVGSFPVSGDKLALRLGAWKYIEAPAEGTRELYELASDPHESRDRMASDPGRANEMQRVLHDWLAATPQKNAELPVLSEHDEQRLHALGYLQ